MTTASNTWNHWTTEEGQAGGVLQQSAEAIRRAKGGAAECCLKALMVVWRGDKIKALPVYLGMTVYIKLVNHWDSNAIQEKVHPPTNWLSSCRDTASLWHFLCGCTAWALVWGRLVQPGGLCNPIGVVPALAEQEQGQGERWQAHESWLYLLQAAGGH